MKLKEIPRTATFAWSPGQHLPIIATGTVAGALDASFSNTTQLELFHLNLHSSDYAPELQPSGTVTSNARFDRLVWGNAADKSHGIIAGGMENGELDLWDPEIILEGGDAEKALLLRNKAHSGNVRGLQFNPLQNNLLGSAATNGEIFIFDLSNPGKPYGPGTRSPKLEEITCLAWNNQVQHIFATSSTTGFTVIWDLKNKREVMHLSYTGPAANLGGNYGMSGMNIGGTLGAGSRRGTTAVAWNPDAATQLITASEDDQNPVIVMWDLRNAHAPEKILAGHEKGILGLSWCQKDADLLLSSGKDNRTLCWNPRTTEIIGELPHSSNWVFDVQWCPGNPDLLASASFDGKIGIHSLQATQDSQAGLLPENDDPFAPIIASQQPFLSLKQPPKWLRRPVGAVFGFGGKLVSFNNKTGSGVGYRVVMSTPVTEPELIRRSVELETSVESKALANFCESREKDTRGGKFDTENWKVLHTLFDENSREQMVKHLGFSKDDVVAQITEAIKNMNLENTAKTKIKTKPSTVQQESSVEAATEEVTSSAFKLEAFKIYPDDESDIDKLITKSIVLGNFESAVNLCLQADRMSEALVLAGFGGSELLQHTQKIYFEKCASAVPYLRLLQGIVSGDLSDVVNNADLSEWQEIVVVLCTFARSEEFGGLCNSLGSRLEEQYQKSLASAVTEEQKASALQHRKNAVLCYLAAGNLENVAKIWVAEQEEEERAVLQKAQQDRKFASSTYTTHANSLQNLIEKVTVFRKAIDYVDSTLDSSETEDSSQKQFKLAPLYDKYIEYAEILVAQGCMSTALKYLSLTPVEYQKLTSVNQDNLVIIRGRLDNSGVDVKSPGLSQAPAQPLQPQQSIPPNQPYYATGDHVAPPAPTTQNTYYQPGQYTNYPPQQLPDSGATSGLYQAPAQPLQPQQSIPQKPYYPTGGHVAPPVPTQNTYYQQQQPSQYANQPSQYSNYPPQQFPDNNTLMQLPLPPTPIVPNTTNVAASSDVSAAYKKSLPSWNDPPMVSAQTKKTAHSQAAANKPQPITSPFPTSTSPAPVGNIYQQPPPPIPSQAARLSPPPLVRGPGQGYYSPGRSTPTPPPPANPVKTPTPVNRHPANDRTHIPAAHKPIFNVLSNELLRARQNSPPSSKKVLDDTEKRLNALFDELNNEVVPQAVIDSLLVFVQALETRNYETAVKIRDELMTTKYEDCQRWIVGLKRLIDQLNHLKYIQ